MVLELCVASIADSEQRFLVLLAKLPLVGRASGADTLAALATVVPAVACGELEDTDFTMVQFIEGHSVLIESIRKSTIIKHLWNKNMIHIN